MPHLSRRKDLHRFYEILERLREKTGFRRLETARLDDGWPLKGVYFFFKEGFEGGLVRVVGPVVKTVWMGKPKRGI